MSNKVTTTMPNLSNVYFLVFFCFVCLFSFFICLLLVYSALELYVGYLYIQMVIIKQELQREDICVVLLRKDKATKVLCILDTIVRKAHWVYGIPKIMLEFLLVPLGQQSGKHSQRIMLQGLAIHVPFLRICVERSKNSWEMLSNSSTIRTQQCN